MTISTSTISEIPRISKTINTVTNSVIVAIRYSVIISLPFIDCIHGLSTLPIYATNDKTIHYFLEISKKGY